MMSMIASLCIFNLTSYANIPFRFKAETCRIKDLNKCKEMIFQSSTEWFRKFESFKLYNIVVEGSLAYYSKIR